MALYSKQDPGDEDRIHARAQRLPSHIRPEYHHIVVLILVNHKENIALDLLD